jgi:hypothetical protein
MVLGLIAAYYLGKTKGINVVVEPEQPQPTETILGQSWSNFDQDDRSFDELLANARKRIEREI